MKHCKECDKILFGRADKKFCGDACRTAYHNRQNAKIRNVVKMINSILLQNWLILRDLDMNGLQLLSKNELSLLGFDFHYFTHFEYNDSGEEIRYCYEFGYHYESSNCVRLLKREMQYSII